MKITRFATKLMHLTKFKLVKFIYDKLKYLSLFMISIIYIETFMTQWRYARIKFYNVIPSKPKQCIQH